MTKYVDRIRKIYKDFPQISVPQDLGDDDDVEKLSEALVSSKARVESCSSFLKAALRSVCIALPHFILKVPLSLCYSVFKSRILWCFASLIS